MNKDIKKIFNNAKKESLSEEKRREIRSYLESEIQGMDFDRSFWQNIFENKSLKIITIMAILLLFISSGVVLAAEKSLPGDFLYVLKVNGNEEIISLVKFSPEAKAQWEVRRIERRIEEFRELERNDNLTDAKIIEIEKQLEKHSYKVDNIDDRNKSIIEIKQKENNNKINNNNQKETDYTKDDESEENVSEKDEYEDAYVDEYFLVADEYDIYYNNNDDENDLLKKDRDFKINKNKNNISDDETDDFEDEYDEYDEYENKDNYEKDSNSNVKGVDDEEKLNIKDEYDDETDSYDEIE